MQDPISYELYVKQLSKIKTRKNNYLPKGPLEKKFIHGGDWKIRKDPFIEKYHETQLGKIKSRKNIYLPNETDLKKQKELKDITEKINKLEKEIKNNDKLINTIKAKENKRKIDKEDEFAQEVYKLQKEQLNKIIEQNKQLKQELKEAKTEKDDMLNKK